MHDGAIRCDAQLVRNMAATTSRLREFETHAPTTACNALSLSLQSLFSLHNCFSASAHSSRFRCVQEKSEQEKKTLINLK